MPRRVADKILNFLTGKDIALETRRLDAAIEANQAEIRQNTQVLESGVRLIESASGALQLASERFLAQHH